MTPSADEEPNTGDPLTSLASDYWNRFPEKIRALTAEEVWNAARQRLAPDNNIIVLVGNLSGFEKDLKKLGPVGVHSPGRSGLRF